VGCWGLICAWNAYYCTVLQQTVNTIQRTQSTHEDAILENEQKKFKEATITTSATAILLNINPVKVEMKKSVHLPQQPE